MAIAINGSGSITGISAGGLPDDCITTADIAAGAVTDAKVNASAAIADSKLSGTTCKAWVNFNGTGVVAIRASYNVSSITDNDVGSYTVNFTTALVDSNYTAVASASDNATLCGISPARETKTTTAVSIITREVASSGNRYDPTQVSIAIFR